MVNIKCNICTNGWWSTSTNWVLVKLLDQYLPTCMGHSQVIEQSTMVSKQVSEIMVSQGDSESHPKTSNIFQRPPAVRALISTCPQWPRAHMRQPSLLSGGQNRNLHASPGAPCNVPDRLGVSKTRL